MQKIARRVVPLLLFGWLLPALHAQLALPTKDMEELAHYTLTMEKVTNVMQSFAELAALSKANPKIAAAVQSSVDKNQGLAAIDRRMAAYPQLAAIFAKHGLTGHEFVVVELTLLQSTFALAADESGEDAAKVAARGHVNPANVLFVKQHQAELDGLRKKYPMGG